MSFEPLEQGSPSKLPQPRSPILNKFTPAAKPMTQNAFLTEVPIQEPLTFPRLYDQNLTDSQNLFYKYQNLNKPYKEPKQYVNQVRTPQTKEPVNIIQKKCINSRLFANKFYETLPVVNNPRQARGGSLNGLMDNSVLTPNGIREVSYKETDSQLMPQVSSSEKSQLVRIPLRKEIHPANAISFLKEQLEREAKLSPQVLKNLTPNSPKKPSSAASSTRSGMKENKIPTPKPAEKKETAEKQEDKKENLEKSIKNEKKEEPQPENNNKEENEQPAEDLGDPLEVEANEEDIASENGDNDEDIDDSFEKSKTSQIGSDFESDRILQVENNLMQERKAREGVEKALLNLAKQQQNLIKKLAESTRKKSAKEDKVKSSPKKNPNKQLDKKQLRNIIADVMTGLEISGNVSNNRAIKRLVNTLKAKHPELEEIVSNDTAANEIPEGTQMKRTTYRTGFTQDYQGKPILL